MRASDTARNVDPTPAVRTWTIDTAVPDTSLDGGTAGPTGDPDATFPFSSPDPAARFECKLDAVAYAACTSPAQYPDLADGSHTFLVRAVDPAGNRDPSPAARQWDVDTVEPETVITSGPDNPTTSTTATFRFNADEEGGTFGCALDGADPIECYAPQEYMDLTPGSHTFTVFASDSAGNYDHTPASYTWTISTPP